MNNVQFDKTSIDNILNYDIVMFDGLDDYWVIWTNKGIFAPKNGRMFHETKEQAMRHWYNACRWSALREAKQTYANTYHPGKKYWEVKFPCSDREIWESFKREMIENYNFQITQWKYVKHNLA